MSAPQKTIEVDPAEEGPKVKAKRQMTEAQLAALKKGREKLAEKRKLPALELAFGPKVEISIDSTVTPVAEHMVEPSAEPATSEAESTNETPEEGNGGNDYAPLCKIM